MYLKIGRRRGIEDGIDTTLQEAVDCLLETVKLQHEPLTVKDAFLKVKADGSAELVILNGERKAGWITPSLKGLQESQLSPRETEILGRLLNGDSNKHIARAFNLSEATVKVHMKSLLRKIGARNRTQAALWALRTGIFFTASEEGSDELEKTAAA